MGVYQPEDTDVILPLIREITGNPYLADEINLYDRANCQILQTKY